MDNRIPPRGFTVAGYQAFDGEPIPASYADGEYWDDTVYPVGGTAVRAEVVLYYQTASRDYVEFLRDENITNSAGPILFDLWDQHSPSPPVEMAHLFVENDAGVLNRCKRSIAKQQAKYLKAYQKEWGRCYAAEAAGSICDSASRDEKLAAAEAKFRQRVGGIKDKKCAGASLTPGSIGHGATCPVPCADGVVFDMNDLASCAVCSAASLGDAALVAGYGVEPPFVPGTAPAGDPARCQSSVAKAASGLAEQWTRALTDCEEANAGGPPVDCSTDPANDIADAIARANAAVARCENFSGLLGCPSAGDVAGTQTCVQTAIGALAPGVAEVSYP
jgi:hypothetical protein